MQKILLGAILLAFAILGVGGAYYVYVLSHELAQSERLNSDLALETRCSEGAARFYKAGGWAGNSQGITSSYKNHWNKKMSKCFVQIDSASLKDNTLFIDIYDAFEGKHYASFNGHIVCDPAIVSAKECIIDSGAIWLDGDDARKTDDHHVGFNGIGNGSVGGANTQTQFLDQIRSFMND